MIENKGTPEEGEALRRFLADADRLLHAYPQDWPMPTPELSRTQAAECLQQSFVLRRSLEMLAADKSGRDRGKPYS